MPLTGKYLKYSPEITLEIFTLIYNKLIENEWTSIDVMLLYNQFTTKWNYIIDYGRGKQFYSSVINRELKETTVQEILGYDPFVKENYISGIDPFIEDDFVLPDKWCIKTIKDKNGKLIGEWFDKQSRRRCYHDTCLGEYYNSYNLLNESIILEGNLAASFASSRIREEYTEITFDQFKKYVLKESIETLKETNPEYVECINAVTPNTRVGEIFKCRHSNKCFEFEYNDKSKENFNSWDGWSVSWSAKIPQKYFKPSTKEAFDAQNKPIEKWSVGSYVVFLKDYLQNNGRKKGDISKITKIRKDTIEFEDNIGNNIDGEFSVVTNLKWFATKTEAEEFAKTLKPKKLLSLNNWYQSGNHVVYLYERNKVYGFHHDKWFTSEGFGENDLKYVDSNTVEEKFTNYIKNNYLIGQSFIDLVNKIDFQIKSYDLNFGNKTTQIYIPVEPNDLRGNKTARIFDKGIWAEHSLKKLKNQVVHCTTQEEWDFVTKKLGYKWSEYSKWSSYKNNTCINLNELGFGTADVAYKGRQILSFKEWCALNGYKMEKEVKFEVGKWYKLNNWISKFNYLEGDYKFYGENINTSTGFVDKFGWMDLNEYTPIEISIEEIQQYLPDNHLDKIKSGIKFEVGDWVVNLEKSISYSVNEICRVSKISKTHLACENKPQTELSMKPFKCFRHATPEEIYNHSTSIGQIPDLGNQGSKIYSFKSLQPNDLEWEVQISNPYSEVLIEQSIGRLDRSLSIFPVFEENPLIQITEFEINKNYFIDFKDPYN